MGSVRQFRIWRGDQGGGQLEDFQVEVNDGEVVLDIIHRLQAEQAPDLAVRWNCKAGKCGSCSMEINGKPRLGCMTRMSTFEESETVTVTPLRTFPVIRDLVTDVSFNYQKAREMPAFAPPAGVAPGDYRMQQVDVERSQEFRKCIECFLCQNTCHVVRDHEDNKKAFAGPRFCNITKCCTEVCPEHIKITDNAIIPMKERVVDNRYDPLVWLGRKIFRRGDLETSQQEVETMVSTPAAAAMSQGAAPEVHAWHRPAPAPQHSPLASGAQVSEVASDRPGSSSPYGDDLTFPLPQDQLTYQHPTADDVR
jgi:succinate dehydrogenase / fumarate reductase iron-sulfur subunit